MMSVAWLMIRPLIPMLLQRRKLLPPVKPKHSSQLFPERDTPLRQRMLWWSMIPQSKPQSRLSLSPTWTEHPERKAKVLER